MTGEDSLEERIDKWLGGIEADIRVGEHDLDSLNKYLESSMHDAETALSSDPYSAYGKVMRTASVTGNIARKRPELVEILSHYVDRFVAVMEKVKKALGAVSFTISVSFPFDMSISLTF